MSDLSIGHVCLPCVDVHVHETGGSTNNANIQSNGSFLTSTIRCPTTQPNLHRNTHTLFHPHTMRNVPPVAAQESSRSRVCGVVSFCVGVIEFYVNETIQIRKTTLMWKLKVDIYTFRLDCKKKTRFQDTMRKSPKVRSHTLPTTNIAPENRWLELYSVLIYWKWNRALEKPGRPHPQNQKTS